MSYTSMKHIQGNVARISIAFKIQTVLILWQRNLSYGLDWIDIYCGPKMQKFGADFSNVLVKSGCVYLGTGQSPLGL